MALQQLDAEHMYFGFLAGARAVIAQKTELNRINVFPVADGDTGNNLTMTMISIIEESRLEVSVKKTMDSIAEAALMGARGNSGIIFAQYLNGLSQAMADRETLSLEEFVQTANAAVAHAYKAISKPVEGTMITVIKDWAQAMGAAKDKVHDYTELLSQSFEVALDSLRHTPDKLKVLRDASVVDSGAKGFVHFLEGFLGFLVTGQPRERGLSERVVTFETEDVHWEEPVDAKARYCTEALIEGQDLDPELVRRALEDLGDALIVAGGGHRVRIHIHTGIPDQVLMKLRPFGRILQQKGEDMQRQYEAIHQPASKIALVTDSIADLPRELMDAHQIHMLPLNVLMSDASYLDKVTLSPVTFRDLMEECAVHPTSSQPGLKETEALLSFLDRHYDQILVITVSQKMSGTYQTFLKAAERLGIEQERIHIVDSRRNSGAQGLIVLKAAEEIAAGGSFEKVLAAAESAIERSEIFVSVNDLQYMIRSGRINPRLGKIAQILNLKPVISIDGTGQGSLIGKAFSLKGNWEKIVELVKKEAEKGPIEAYAVVHAGAPERAGEFVSSFTELIGKPPLYVMEISTIVALSAGLGSVALALLRSP